MDNQAYRASLNLYDSNPVEAGGMRKMMSEVNFYRVVDREPKDWTKSSNGGDYEEGRTIAVKDSAPIAVRFWSSWDGGFCHRCGRYEPFECDCDGSLRPVDYEDWQSGALLEGWDAELAQSRLDNNGFVLIEAVLA